MKPERPEDGLVDVLDVLLRDGVVIEADVILTVADVPLVGIRLRAAIAGMTRMVEYGYFTGEDAAATAGADPDPGSDLDLDPDSDSSSDPPEPDPIPDSDSEARR